MTSPSTTGTGTSTGKAIVVVDFAYKGPQRKGRGTGRKGLSSTLKYLQYRDRVQNLLAQNRDYER